MSYSLGDEVSPLLLAIAAPAAAELALGSVPDDIPAILLGLVGCLLLPPISGYLFERFGRAPEGAGWWLFVLNFFLVGAVFFLATRHIKFAL